MVLQPCNWCSEPICMPEEALEHVATCPKAPARLRRVAGSGHAISKAMAAGEPLEQLTDEAGFAIVDDLFEGLPPSELAELTPGFLAVWVSELWAKVPSAVSEAICEAALRRLKQRQEQPS